MGVGEGLNATWHPHVVVRKSRDKEKIFSITGSRGKRVITGEKSKRERGRIRPLGNRTYRAL